MENKYCHLCTEHMLTGRFYRVIEPPEIINIACSFLGVGVDRVLGKGRKRTITDCRQMIMSYLSNSRKIALSDIAIHFKRHHSTVIHAKQHVLDMCDTDKNYLTTFNSLTKHLNKKHYEHSQPV